MSVGRGTSDNGNRMMSAPTFVFPLILLALVDIAFALEGGGRFPTIEMTVEQSKKGFGRDAAYAGAATITGRPSAECWG